jgi:hypothetical protein
MKLNDDFTVNFYPDSTLKPDIRCITDGFYGVDVEVSIDYEQAKQMIEGLQNFVQAVDKKKQNDRVTSLGLEKYYQQ